MSLPLWMYFCCLYLRLLLSVNSFNIDIKHPVIYAGNPGSYFGYSVALLNNSEGTWVVVGAPKDNDTLQPHVVRPGVVYLCPFPPQSDCSKIPIDATGNAQQTLRFHGRNLTFHNEKNDQWLGATLDVHPKFMDSILVCAYRWTDSYTHRKMGDILHMNGICYQVNSNMADTGRPVPALTRLDRLVNQQHRYAEFSMGTLGVSAIFSNDGGQLLMGAPGLNDWSGGLVMERKSNYSSDVQYIEPPRTLYHDSYIGYSIVTGKFVSRSSYGVALGAPTGKGKVLFYGLNYPKRLPEFTIDGDQLGSYFGSVLCTINLDNDGWDDILIGAPLYAKESKVEQGLVYVFRTRGAMGFNRLQTLTGSAAERARFGSAIVNLGDINDDGFQDIAVGAPLEDDGRGMVYLYNGYKSGIWPQYSQKIAPKKIHRGLRGFGSSFSRSFDLDHIGFNDFAVGAYLSDHVVFLRSRPLVDIIATMDTSPRVVDVKNACQLSGLIMPCITINLCFLYTSTGQGIPSDMEVKYNLQFDTERKVPRAVVYQSSGPFAVREMTSVSGKVMLKKHMMNCKTQYIVYIRSLEDKGEGLQLQMSYKGKFRRRNCDICPMTQVFDGKNKMFQRRNRISATIHFAKDCGIDDICRTDLQLHMQTVTCNGHNLYCIIGDNNDVKIITFIRSNGEVAYSSILYFRIPSEIRLYRSFLKWNNSMKDISCHVKLLTHKGTLSSVSCSIGDILAGKGEIILEFMLKSIHKYSDIDIETDLFTSSTETNVTNNSIRKNLKVMKLPRLKMSGYSEPDQQVLRGFLGEKQVTENITHSFHIYNDGPSALNQSSLSISVPLIPRQVFLTSYKIDGVSNNKQKISCDKDPLVYQINSEDEPSILQTTLNISCGEYSCVTINCQLNNFTKYDVITLYMFLGVSKEFTRQHKTVRHVVLVSNATLVIPDDPRLLLDTKQIHAWAVTDVFSPRSKVNKDEDYLLIAVISLCSGLIMIVLIGIVLRKCGFFRRTQKDILLRLQASRWELLTHGQNGREDETDTSSRGEGSNENLVVTEYITVLNSPPQSDYSPDSPTSRNFDVDYLEPIRTLFRR